MASSSARRATETRRNRHRNEGAPTMWAAFAGIILFLNGSFAILYGLAAIINDKVVTVGGRPGVTIWDFTTWGWIVLGVGCLMLLAGAALLMGRAIGRWLGIAFAVLSALTQFGTMSAFPLWSLMVIALDVIIIYQLAVHWDTPR